jgi:hypothetical protein
MSVQCTLPVHRAVHEHLAIRKKRSPALRVQVCCESFLFLWFIFGFMPAVGLMNSESANYNVNAPGICVSQLRLVYLLDADISELSACLQGRRSSSQIPLGRQTDAGCQHCAERTTVRMRERERDGWNLKKNCDSTCSGLDKDFPNIFCTAMHVALTFNPYLANVEYRVSSY